jgi:uncharacterized protein
MSMELYYSSSNEQIQSLVEQIVHLVKPKKVILFGSRATGLSNPESDVDLLIVIQDGFPRRKTAQFLYQNLRGISLPYDLIVTTEDNPGLVYSEALRTGKEVYVC